MASKKKNKNEIRYALNDDDYSAFGRYRILYTAGGRKLVNHQRLTYFISGVMIALLFTLFHVDHSFTILAYVVAAVIGIGGPIVSERMLLRQQEKAIKSEVNNADRLHPEENIVTLGDDVLVTEAGENRQEFDYKDIKLVDLTEEAIYVWMSDTMIMPIPLHAFKDMEDMKETYTWIREKIREKGGNVAD